MCLYNLVYIKKTKNKWLWWKEEMGGAESDVGDQDVN